MVSPDTPVFSTNKTDRYDIKDNLFSVNADGTCTYSLYHTYKCMTLMINYEIIIKLTIVSLLCLTMALCSISG